MHHGDLAGGAAQIFPIIDGAHEDGHHLLLGEFEAAAGLVEAQGNGAAHGGDLHHAAAHLGLVFGGDRVVGGGEAHGFVDERLTASTGTHGLVVHLGAAGFGEISKPAGINFVGEGGAGRIQPVAGKGCAVGTEQGQRAEDQGLLREGHGRDFEGLCSRSKGSDR